MDAEQERTLIDDIRSTRDVVLRIEAKLEERCPANEKRISRLEKAFIGIASTIVLSLIAAILTGFLGG